MTRSTAMETSVGSLITERPLLTFACLALVAAGTTAIALALRRFQRTSRSLRRSLLVVAMSSLVIALVTAVVAARLMVLSGRELASFASVAAVAAGLALVLVIVVSQPLRDDVRALETTVRAVETGNRSVRVDCSRADELGHVARAINDLVSRLEVLEHERDAVERERQSLLSNVGHDLRTPLAALQSAIEALLDGVVVDRDQYLHAMQQDVEALRTLVDDLSLLSRLDVGRYELELEPVDLVDLADDAVQALQPTARAVGVTMVLNADRAVRVVGSAPALARVLRNLIDNGIRHTPRGGCVSVDVVVGGDAVVRVTDDGPGFPSEFRARAFDRFSRADESRSRASGGAGLGLAIARGLVEAHGGRIWIDDTAAASVAFSVPRMTQPTGGPARSRLQSSASARASGAPTDVRPTPSSPSASD